MKALLLAAGEGTRLRPLTSDRPKPMVALGGRPIVSYLLAWLSGGGVTDVAVNLHYQPEVLRQYVGTGSAFGLRVRYSPEPVLLGSAGALVPLRSFFEGPDPFVVLYGDVLTDLELGPLIAFHRSRNADVTLAVTRAEDPSRGGVVDFDRGGLVTRFREKPPKAEVFSPWVNAGVYLCSSAALRALPEPCPVPYDFAGDLFPRMLAAGARLMAFPTDATVLDIGSPERLRFAEDRVRSGWLNHLGAVGAC